MVSSPSRDRYYAAMAKKLDKNVPAVKHTKSEGLREIGDTLLKLVTPDMTPKQLLKAVKKAHPKASKQEVVRAAFYAIISKADKRQAFSRASSHWRY